MGKGFEVYKRACSNCLLSEKRIVSEERADEIVEECINEGKYFVCHVSSDKSGEVCCSRFFHEIGDKTGIVRIAKRLNVVSFVENPDDFHK